MTKPACVSLDIVKFERNAEHTCTDSICDEKVDLRIRAKVRSVKYRPKAAETCTHLESGPPLMQSEHKHEGQHDIRTDYDSESPGLHPLYSKW